MEITPSLLEFRGSFTKPTTEYLTLSNTSSTPLAFKVKTTAPKLYCVRPNASMVEPGSSVKISIILQGFSQPLPSDYKCKDKFLLVSLPCPDLKDSSKVSEIWSELESSYKSQLVSKKLRVNYIIQEDEDDEEDKEVGNATSQGNGFSGTSAVEEASSIAAASKIDKASAPSDLQKELEESNAQINDLSKKLDSNEKAASTPGSASNVSSEEPVNGVSLPFAVILVLLAFILGWLIF